MRYDIDTDNDPGAPGLVRRLLDLAARIETLERISSAPSTQVLPGCILWTIGSTADSGYFLIDGSTVTNAQTLYPSMWARLPASWKSGSSMVMPDWRAKTAFMAGTGFTLGATGGANTVTLSSANLPVHTHAIDHDHAAFTSAVGSSHTHAIDHNHANVTSTTNSAGHTHDIDHNHAAVTSGNNSVDHVHNVAGTNQYLYRDTAYTLNESSTKPAAGGGVAINFQAPSGASATHTHSVDLPALGTTASGAASATHTHDVDLPNFTGTSGADASHTHSIDVPAFTGASGNGGFANTAISVTGAYGVVNFQIKT